jgi:hypothetical protein
MTSSILATISAWSLAWLPAMVGGQPPADQPRRPRSDRGRTVRVDDDGAARHANLFLPAGVGPHPVLLLDAADRAVNLRAEAHRFASIGVAAFFRDGDEPGAEPLTDVAARVDYVRARGDINPYELGALCFGEPADGWLHAAAVRGASFLIRVTVRGGLPAPAVTRESAGPQAVPLLDVLALRAPLAPEATRLVDAWLLRHVTIRS